MKYFYSSGKNECPAGFLKEERFCAGKTFMLLWYFVPREDFMMVASTKYFCAYISYALIDSI